MIPTNNLDGGHGRPAPLLRFGAVVCMVLNDAAAEEKQLHFEFRTLSRYIQDILNKNTDEVLGHMHN